MATFVIAAAVLAVLTIPQNAVLRRDAEGSSPDGTKPGHHHYAILHLPWLNLRLDRGNGSKLQATGRHDGRHDGNHGRLHRSSLAAAQFVAFFQWSNMGLLTALTGAEILKGLGVGNLPLILTFVFLAAGDQSGHWVSLR